eukprot:4885286-Prymnesium_polylepis.1
MCIRDSARSAVPSTVASPDSRSTVAEMTPSTAARAVVTRPEQPPQDMPSMRRIIICVEGGSERVDRFVDAESRSHRPRCDDAPSSFLLTRGRWPMADGRCCGRWP